MNTATFESELASLLLARVDSIAPIADDYQWPSGRYARDPVGFFREVLGIQPTPKQARVLEALCEAAHKTSGGRIAVKAGRKVGKSTLGAGAALWFYSCFVRSSTFLAAPSMHQIDDILWKELRRLHRIAIHKLDGVPALRSITGLTAGDDRSIRGMSSDSKETTQGMSARQFYVIDEASGVNQDVFDAIEGNRAGGFVLVLLLANPTKNTGEFYEAFHGKSAFYTTFTISSEESPNYVAGEEMIPFMATREWVQEMERMWGRASSLFKIYVLGEFAEGEDGRIIALSEIAAAEQRDPPETNDPLIVGLDPAGPGPGGDEIVWFFRRGYRSWFRRMKGLTTAAIVAHTDGFVSEFAKDEEVVISVDREGSIGAEVYGALRARAAQPGVQYRIYGVRASEKAERQPREYELTRDELWAACARWLAEGGSIPEDAKLAQDLHAPSWLATIRGRQTVTPKKELRKMLGRSPDTGEALCLATWIQGHERDAWERREHEAAKLEDARNTILGNSVYDTGIDPYGAMR